MRLYIFWKENSKFIVTVTFIFYNYIIIIMIINLIKSLKLINRGKLEYSTTTLR